MTPGLQGNYLIYTDFFGLRLNDPVNTIFQSCRDRASVVAPLFSYLQCYTGIMNFILLFCSLLGETLN